MKRFLYLLALVPFLVFAAVQQIPQSPQKFIGLSSDTKPVQGISPGALFLETDTGKTYIWKGNTTQPGASTDWVQFGEGVSLQTLISGEDTTNTVLKVEQRFSYSGDKTGDVQVKASAGFVHTVTCQGTDAAATAGTITLYDNTAESGTKIWEWDVQAVALTSPVSVLLDATAATGLYLGFATTADVSCTVTYR